MWMMSEGDAIIERMYECMDLFSEATNAWFKHAFNAPTEAQRLAWPAIRSGENVLVVAPTGSGKTLCAFLSAIDRLMTKESDDLLRTSGGGDGTAESDCNAKKRKPVRGVKVLYMCRSCRRKVAQIRNLIAHAVEQLKVKRYACLVCDCKQVKHAV